MITIHGHEFNVPPIKDSYSRRATQLANKIFQVLKDLGISPDDIDIPEERMPMRKAPAEVSWWCAGYFCHFTYTPGKSYVENLYVIQKVLELEVKSVIEEKKSMEEFLQDFREDHDIKDLRKEARKTLGVEEDCMDIKEIDSKYKKLAKEHHPDMPNGNEVEFKKFNIAHKILRKELEQ
jgi:hypothetical protein